MKEHTTADVIIPAYKPGEEFGELLARLKKQEYPIRRIIIMNTEKEWWNTTWEQKYGPLEVHHLKKEEFDHGGTRKWAAAHSDADILVFMTQDALPADRTLIGSLIRPILEYERVGASYARQLPKKGCGYLERSTRQFNYPEESVLRGKEDIPEYGIKTFFCSNVCAAYDRRIYESLGGFVEHAIFNEDMIYAGKMVQNGYQVAYAAEARVFHSHDYSAVQQMHRNFDLGVSQAQHPEIFAGTPSEGEGLRLVKRNLATLVRSGHFYLVPKLIWQSGFKYAGYFLGKRYERLPMRLIGRLTMNPEYWKKNTGR